MTHTTVILSLGPLCPWLILLLGLQALAGVCGLKKRGWARLVLLVVVAAGLLQVPIKGTTVAAWVRGLSGDFSLPFTGLLVVAVCQHEFRRTLFSKADWTAAWAFGAIAGVVLYPMALGWGRFDPYKWGWRFSPLFVVSAVLTAALVWKQNRFGILLLLAVAACHLHLLESSNCWDYLLDPVYCLASIAALGFQLTARTRQPQPRPVPGPGASVAS
jgi:hypothetical protein